MNMALLKGTASAVPKRRKDNGALAPEVRSSQMQPHTLKARPISPEKL